MIDAPPELAARPQWVAWRYEQREGEAKLTKVPINAHTGRLASTTDPSTWSSFEEASSYAERYGSDGVGYVLSQDDPYAGIDLDHCRDPESGTLEPWAKAIVRRLSSYTEISPSGTGLRIFVIGELPPHGRRKGPIEVYCKARFLTITGDRYMAAPPIIKDRQAELLAWHHEVFGEPPAHTNGHAGAVGVPTALADAEVVEHAARASNGTKFWALWNGDYSDYPTQSEADLALANFLAFWAGPDPPRIEQLFSLSGLNRDKWEQRADYRDRTIGLALQGRTDYYDPHFRSGGAAAFGIGATNGTRSEAPAAAPASGYRFVQISRVLTGEDADEQLVEGLLWRRRVHWVFAGAGTGKTLWSMAEGLHIAAGRPFLGREVLQGAVILIEEDSPLDTAQNYADVLCSIYDISFEDVPFYMNDLQGLRIRDEAGLTAARSAVAQCEQKPVLVILDAAERLVPSKEFSSDEIDPLDRFLKGLVNENIVPVVIDHINRRGRADVSGKRKAGAAPAPKPIPLDLLYGGQSKHAISDVMLYLDGNLREGPVQASWEKFRVSGSAPPNFSIRFNDEDGFSLTEHRREPATEQQREVRRFLVEHPGWHKLADIEAVAHKSDRTLRRALSALVTQRWIEVEGHSATRQWRTREDVEVAFQ